MPTPMRKMSSATYLNKLLQSAMQTERQMGGNPISLCAIQQVKQQVAGYNLQTPAGRRAAVNTIEQLATQKNCNICNLVGAGTIELRSRWNIQNPAPAQTPAQMNATLESKGIRIITPADRGKV